jgi:2,4-dienoyl-CoA reductase-like NADH-dependent reductase (Old Yellow Enzyme family)
MLHCRRESIGRSINCGAWRWPILRQGNPVVKPWSLAENAIVIARFHNGGSMLTSTKDRLFTPFQLGPLRLRNRFVMSPMTRNFSPKGVPGDNVAAYYRRRAEADVGLIITEGIGVDHPAAVGSGSMGEHDIPLLYGDEPVAGWRHVVEQVHAAGGRIMPQLWHMGPIRLPGTGPVPDAPPSRPSGIWGPTAGVAMPQAYLDAVAVETQPLSDSEIADIVAGYARSAANAYRIGCDGVAIHGAHGYLIDSFLWPSTNLRDDAWGGDIVRRSAFAAEVVRAIRAATSPDFPIMFRFSQWKLQDYTASNASTPAELEAMLGPISDAGVNIFDASTRVFSTPAFNGSEMGLAGWAKKLTGKASMTVGGIGFSKDLQSSFVEETHAVNNLAAVAERFERGEFDLVAIGRALLMDSQWVRKARTGEAFLPFRLSAYASLD